MHDHLHLALFLETGYHWHTLGQAPELKIEPVFCSIHGSLIPTWKLHTTIYLPFHKATIMYWGTLLRKLAAPTIQAPCDLFATLCISGVSKEPLRSRRGVGPAATFPVPHVSAIRLPWWAALQTMQEFDFTVDSELSTRFL